MKCHPYPESITIDGFEQKICICHNPKIGVGVEIAVQNSDL